MQLTISQAAGFKLVDVSSQKTFEFAGNLSALEEGILRYKKSSFIAVIHPGAELETVSAAETAIANGTLKLNQANGRSYLLSIQGGTLVVYEWEPVGHEGHGHFHPAGAQEGNTHFINFHGANTLAFTADAGLLKWDTSWWMSIKHRTLTANALQQTLFKNGSNYINFAAGAGNYGVYVGNVAANIQLNSNPAANQWFNPEFMRVLFNFDHTTRMFYYWAGVSGSNGVLKWAKNVDTAAVGAMPNNSDGLLKIANPVVSSPASSNWLGGENFLMGGAMTLGTTQIQELYGHSPSPGTSEDPSATWDLSFPIDVKVNMGEDVWPAVNGIGLSGGMIGGSAADFVSTGA